MSWHITTGVFALLLAANLATIVAVILLQKRDSPGVSQLALIMFAVSLWSYMALFELLAVELSSKLFWIKLQRLPMLTIPPLFLMFAISYGREGHWLNPRNTALLWVIPLISLTLLFTNEFHHLYWYDIPLYADLTSWKIGRGLWYWVSFIYSHLCLFVGTIIAIRAVYRYYPREPGFMFAVMVALFLPWATNFLYNLGLLPYVEIDPTPYALMITGIILLASIYRYRFPDVMPIARSKLVDTMEDAVIVLDQNGSILDLNPASRSLFGIGSRSVAGEKATEVFKSWDYLSRRFQGSLIDSTEVNTIQDIKGSSYDLRISPIKQEKGETKGWLIVLHDVSRQKEAETNLAQQARDLQVIADLSLITSTTLNLEHLTIDVVGLVQTHFGYSHVKLYVSDSDELKNILTQDTADPNEQSIEELLENIDISNGSLICRAVRTKQVQTDNHMAYVPTFPKNTILPETRSEIAIPLIAGNHFLGVLDVQANEYDRFSDRDINILNTLALQIAIALQNTNTFSKLEETLKILRIRQDQLREAMLASQMGSYEFDGYTQIITISDELLEIIGTTREIEGGNQIFASNFVRKFLHPEDSPAVLEDLNLAFSNPQVVNMERQFRCLLSGEIRYMLTRAAILRDEDGNAIKMTGTIQDITARVESEAEVSRLATVIDQASDMVMITDIQGNIVYVNPIFENSTGYTLSEIIGENPRILQSGAQDKLFYKNLWDTLASGKVWQGNFINKRKNGDLYHEAASIFPIRNAQGMVINYAAVKRDITRQVELETAENEQRRLAETINEIGKALTTTLDFEHQIDIMLEQIERVVPYDTACIFIIEGSTVCPIRFRNFERFGAEAVERIKTVKFDIEQTENLKHMYKTRQPFIVPDTRQYTGWESKYNPYPIYSWIGAPITTKDRVIGFFSLDKAQPDFYTERHAYILGLFVSDAALAIENARLYQEALSSREHSDAVRYAVQEISAASLDRDEIFPAIYNAVQRLVPTDEFTIFLENETTAEIEKVYWKSRDELHPHTYETISQYLANDVKKKKQSLIVNNISEYLEASSYPSSIVHTGSNSFLVVPLNISEQVFGAIVAQNNQPDAYTETNKHTLELIAAPTSVAIENTRLYLEVHRLAITDSLTGLYNRRHFFDLGRTELERSWRYKRPLSAIMMDVDHFKSINDSFGHSSGDCVLQAIANLCVESMRKLDIIGRYGGEEFVILLPETDNEQAHQAAERLREEISRLRVSTGHGEISVTASFGVHTFDSIFYQDTLPDDQLDKLIDLADQALLTAKQLGRNRVAF